MQPFTLFIITVLSMVSTLPGQTPPSSKEYLQKGMSELQRGEFDAGNDDLTKAIELDATNGQAYLLRAFGRMMKHDLDGALADYNKIIKMAPKTPGIETAYNNRAMVKVLKGDRDGALLDLNQAIVLNPYYAEAYNGRGTIRMDKGDFDGGLADFNKAIELNPNMIAAYENRAILELRRGAFNAAVEDSNKALTLGPGNPYILVGRGIAKALRGDLDDGITDIKKAIAIYPEILTKTKPGFSTPLSDLDIYIESNQKDARAYEIRGLLRLMQGKTDDAEQDLKKSISLDNKLQSEIERIKKDTKPQ